MPATSLELAYGGIAKDKKILGIFNLVFTAHLLVLLYLFGAGYSKSELRGVAMTEIDCSIFCTDDTREENVSQGTRKYFVYIRAEEVDMTCGWRRHQAISKSRTSDIVKAQRSIINSF